MNKVITTWSGVLAQMPKHYDFCNGSKGTPDLRDKFVMAVTQEAEVNTVGGSDVKVIPEHTHTVPAHTHVLTDVKMISASVSTNFPSDSTSSRTNSSSTTHVHTVPVTMDSTESVESNSGSVTSKIENRPAFYALAYVKLDANALPVDTIAMWDSAIADIPEGWTVCNGANGTPNLSNQFIKGAGLAYDVGTKGGVNSHTEGPHSHSFTHSHVETITANPTTNTTSLMKGYGGSSVAAVNHTHKLTATIGGEPVVTSIGGEEVQISNLPQYHSLIFIKRIA